MPSVAHQLPVVVSVTVEEINAVELVVGMELEVVVFADVELIGGEVVVLVAEVVLVVVEEEHDDSIDVTNKQMTRIQPILIFILSPFLSLHF